MMTLKRRSTLSLRERISKASCNSEVAALLAEGALYDNATPRTRAQWLKAAQQRKKELLDNALAK